MLSIFSESPVIMSPTPTLLRVKRRKNEDPLDVLVLSAKKRKTCDSDEAGNIKILKLATTVDAEDDTKSNLKIAETVNKLIAKKSYPNFEELRQQYKKHITHHKDSPAKEVKEKLVESRQEHKYRIISQKRSLKIEDLEDWPQEDSKADDTKDTGPGDKELFHLYDVVSDHDPVKKTEKEPEKISCNGVEMIREFVDAQKVEEDYGFVYDVYYTDHLGADSGDFDDSLLDNLVSIHPFNSGHGFDYGEYRDDPEEFKYEDDEDSNDECNDRNDYPDEDYDDEDGYYGGYGDDDDDLGTGVAGLGLCDSDGDLSSDDDDQLLYTRSFEQDEAASGSAYARFKQKMLKEFYEDDLDEYDDDDDDDD